VNDNKKKPVLVAGGGMSGITAAIELAETGRDVILVEKNPYLGGNVLRMSNYFPKLCPPACGLEINFRRIRQSRHIKCYTSTEVVEVTGKMGSFKVSLRTEPAYVNDNCSACGNCADVCPVTRPDSFNYNFSETKAACLPHEMAYPFRYHIDGEYCKKHECGKCLDVCDYNAIDLSAQPHNFEVEAANGDEETIPFTYTQLQNIEVVE